MEFSGMNEVLRKVELIKVGTPKMAPDLKAPSTLCTFLKSVMYLFGWSAFKNEL